MYARLPSIILTLLGFFALAVYTSADEAQTHVYDEVALPTENPSSFPNHLLVAGPALYFVADDGIHGRELWTCNNEGECRLAADLWKGQTSSNPEGLTPVGDWLYFTAETGQFGRTGWVWDPGEGQCRQLRNAESGRTLSSIHFWGTGRNCLYLVGTSGLLSSSLFVVEFGSSEASLVRSLWPRTVGGETPKFAVGSGGDLFYYIGSDLCRSDGTAAGSRPIVDFGGPGDFYLTGAIAALRDAIVFVGFDETHGREPWIVGPERSDRTPHLLRDIAPGVAPSKIGEFFAHKGQLFFGADDGEHGKELWVTDGTGQGTQLVKDIHPGRPSSEPYYFVSGAHYLYFVAVDGTHGAELWRSDGTEQGTTLVVDLRPGVQGSGPWRLTRYGDKVAFCASSPTFGEEIFLVDETTGEVHILKDIVSGPGNSGPHQLTVFEGQLYFTCNDGEHGEELWVSDGTDAGTRLAADISPIRFNPPSRPHDLTAVGDRLFFVVSDNQHGEELWTSDGTSAGTELVRDIASGGADSSPQFLTPLGEMLFFTAKTAAYGRELWRTDGTPEGTTCVKDIAAGEDGSNPQDLCAVHGLLYFAADDRSHGRALWRSDGTSDGTFMLRGEGADMPDLMRAHLLDAGAYAFLCVDNNQGMWSLWRSDGSRAGTTHVGDFPIPGATSNPTDMLKDFPSQLTESENGAKQDASALLAEMAQWTSDDPDATRPVTIDGVTYFVAGTVDRGAELWKTDGTLDGTRLVQDIFPGPPSSGPTYLTKVDQDLYFIAEHPVEGRVLWKSDGSALGTDFVHLTNNVGASFSVLTLEIAALDHMLVLSSLPSFDRQFDPENAEVRFFRPEDVSRRATEEMYNVRRGPPGSWPRNLTRAGSQVFFTAADGVHGRELWVTDGTPEGTRLVLDILGPGDLESRSE